MTDSAPCTGCPHLVAREGYAPYCDRNAQYGQACCVRKSRPLSQDEWLGESPRAREPQTRRARRG